MKQKIILSLILGIFMFGMVSATMCYQESANVATSCGGLNTGNYNSFSSSWFEGYEGNIAYDGNWDSSARNQPGSGWANFYINYSKPTGALSTSLWKVRYGYNGHINENITLPIACFNQNVIQYKISTIDTGFGSQSVNLTCYNGTAFQLIGTGVNQTPNNGDNSIYEEAMWWNISVPLPTDKCNYYIGSEAFTLPKVTTTKVYDDSPTHKMYLACLYNLDGKSGYESMINTQDCRKDIQTFNPNVTGKYTYKLDIAYRERVWDSTSNQWVTTSDGTETPLVYDFTVCSIPDDSEGFQGFINWVRELMCSLFGWFC